MMCWCSKRIFSAIQITDQEKLNIPKVSFLPFRKLTKKSLVSNWCQQNIVDDVEADDNDLDLGVNVGVNDDTKANFGLCVSVGFDVHVDKNADVDDNGDGKFLAMHRISSTLFYPWEKP